MECTSDCVCRNSNPYGDEDCKEREASKDLCDKENDSLADLREINFKGVFFNLDDTDSLILEHF